MISEESAAFAGGNVCVASMLHSVGWCTRGDAATAFRHWRQGATHCGNSRPPTDEGPNCKVQLLLAGAPVPGQSSVTLIAAHLVPSWFAECSRLLHACLSHPLGRVCHTGAIESARCCKIGFLTWPPVQRLLSSASAPFFSADGQDSWDNLVI